MTNARTVTGTLFATIVAGAALLLTWNGAPDARAAAGPVDNAFDAIRDLEAVYNARDDEGNYLLLDPEHGYDYVLEGVSAILTEDYVGVNGFGAISAGPLGYQPTISGWADAAASSISTKALGVAADQFNGGNGTADFVHVAYDGGISGNTGYFLLNFGVLGTPDMDGSRSPVEVPNFMLGLEGDGSVPLQGRCICTCERIAGTWRIASFYFVFTPDDEMLYDVQWPS